MDLAFAAKISPRHLSFVETGRSKPSRGVLLKIADALRMTLRDRNTLLEAAGYSREYGEGSIDGPELEPFRRVLQFMLARHEPYSAVVVDRFWNVLYTNRAYTSFLQLFLPADVCLPPEAQGNVLRLLFDERGLRPALVNWAELAGALIQRLHREAMTVPDGHATTLLDELLSYPGVPPEWRHLDPLQPAGMFLPIHLKSAAAELRLMGTVTVFGTAHDVTLEELRLETFFPADDETERAIQQLWGDRSQPGGSHTS